MNAEQLSEFVQNHLLLVMGFVGVSAGLMWTLLVGKVAGLPRIGVTEVTRLINREEAVIVDVRGSAEFKKSHIVNSMHLPEKELEQRIGMLESYKSRPIVTVCGTGQASARLGGALKKRGFSKVYALDGGLISWQNANLPLETGS